MRTSGAIVCSGVIDGTSIVSANVFFALSNSSTNTPDNTAFTYDDFPPLNAGNYVWQATKITDSDGKTSLTGKMCLGPTTDFLSGTEVYAISTSNSTAPAENTTNWKTTYEKTKGYYLWTATRVQYTNGNYAYLNKKCVGYWGEDGNGIQSVARTYARSKNSTSTNDTTAPSNIDTSIGTNGWAASSPSVTETYPYLWVKEVVTYTKSEATTKYYCIGARGDNGVDAQDIEWVYIRTKTNVAPVISGDGGSSPYTDHNSKTYTSDDHLPKVVAGSGGSLDDIEDGNSGSSSKKYECTDDPKGVDSTWKFEWEIKREKGAADANGHRAWQAYSGTMTLHNRYVKDITSANVWYALADSGTAKPDNDAFTLDAFPTTLNAGKYVWEATKVTYSDGTSEFTAKMCLGPTTDFLSGTEVYAISTSNSTAPAENTTNWKTTYEKTKGYYLWTATRVQYTNGNYAYLNKKCVGYWGEDGDNAKYIYLRGTGLNNNADRLLNITSNSNRFETYKNNRGLVVARINRSTLAVSGITWFDVYGGTSEGTESIANTKTARAKFITYLTNTSMDYFLAVTSYDAIGITDAMIAKLKEFGLGSLEHTVDDDDHGYRNPFAFLGYKGLQQGYALYQLQGTEDNAPYAEVMAYVANGVFMSSKDGDNAPYDVVTYGRSKSRESYGSSYLDTSYGTDGWGSTAPSATSTYPYIWERRQSYDKDRELQNTSYICLTGASGPTVQGKMGRFLWYAGLLSEVGGTTFTVDDYQAPYVNIGTEDEPHCYAYVGSNGSNISYPSSASGYTLSNGWDDMTTEFKYLIAKAIFSNYAQLGGFIVNKDYFLSQYGTLIAPGGSEITINASNVKTKYNLPQYILYGNNRDGGRIIRKISFTVSSTTVIGISAVASSEEDYDIGAVGVLDSTALQGTSQSDIRNGANCLTVNGTKMYVSGTQKKSVQVTVNAGTHFFYIAYAKDGTYKDGDDNAIFTFWGAPFTVEDVSASEDMTSSVITKSVVPYAWFDPSDPVADNAPITGYKFRPTKCINALTGEEWNASGNVHTKPNGDVILKKLVQFGSAVISGDWLISVHGKINDVFYGGAIESPENYNGYPAYTYFDPSTPQGYMGYGTNADASSFDNNSYSSSNAVKIDSFYLSPGRKHFVVSGDCISGNMFAALFKGGLKVAGTEVKFTANDNSDKSFIVNIEGGNYELRAYTDGGMPCNINGLSKYTFAPNYCLDLKRGIAYQTTGVISGFLRKAPTNITTSNINQYKRDDIQNATVLDFDKCGSFIRLYPGTSSYFALPLLSSALKDRYTLIQKDQIRGFVGTKIILHNRSGISCSIVIRYTKYGTGVNQETYTLNNGNCAELECYMDRDENDGTEIICWKVNKTAEPV